MKNIFFNADSGLIYQETETQKLLIYDDSITGVTPSSLLHSWTFADDANYDSANKEFTDSENGLILKADVVSFSTDHDGNTDSSIWGNYTSQYFAGPNQLVSTTNSLIPTGNIDLSIACWIYNPSPNPYNSECWWIFGSTGGHSAALRNGAGATIGVEDVGIPLTGDVEYTESNWTWFCWTHDATTNNNVLYADNVSAVFDDQSIDITKSPFYVFGSEGIYDNWPTPNGYISQLSIYNKVLDATERQNIMDTT